MSVYNLFKNYGFYYKNLYSKQKVLNVLESSFKRHFSILGLNVLVFNILLIVSYVFMGVNKMIEFKKWIPKEKTGDVLFNFWFLVSNGNLMLIKVYLLTYLMFTFSFFIYSFSWKNKSGKYTKVIKYSIAPANFFSMFIVFSTYLSIFLIVLFLS